LFFFHFPVGLFSIFLFLPLIFSFPFTFCLLHVIISFLHTSVRLHLLSFLPCFPSYFLISVVLFFPLSLHLSSLLHLVGATVNSRNQSNSQRFPWNHTTRFSRLETTGDKTKLLFTLTLIRTENFSRQQQAKIGTQTIIIRCCSIIVHEKCNPSAVMTGSSN
jgi:hypothetical protein